MNIHAHKSSKIVILLAMLSAIVFSNGIAEDKAEAPILIVVNKDVSVENISMKELRSVWLGKMKHLHGHRINRYYSEKLSEVNKKFYEKVFRKTPRQIKKYFLRELLKGGASAPVDVKNVTELLSLLNEDINGLAFVSEENFDVEENFDLKTLSINGYSIGDKLYPLK